VRDLPRAERQLLLDARARAEGGVVDRAAAQARPGRVLVPHSHAQVGAVKQPLKVRLHLAGDGGGGEGLVDPLRVEALQQHLCPAAAAESGRLRRGRRQRLEKEAVALRPLHPDLMRAVGRRGAHRE